MRRSHSGGSVGASSACHVPKQGQLAGSAPSFDRPRGSLPTKVKVNSTIPLLPIVGPVQTLLGVNDAVRVGLIALSHCCLVFGNIYQINLFFCSVRFNRVICHKTATKKNGLI